MELIYGIPALAALVGALVYVHRTARRRRLWRATGQRQMKFKAPPQSLRSEMRLGESTISVMDEIERTQSGSPRFTGGGKGTAPDSRTRTSPREKS